MDKEAFEKFLDEGGGIQPVLPDGTEMSPYRLTRERTERSIANFFVVKSLVDSNMVYRTPNMFWELIFDHFPNDPTGKMDWIRTPFENNDSTLFVNATLAEKVSRLVCNVIADSVLKKDCVIGEFYQFLKYSRNEKYEHIIGDLSNAMVNGAIPDEDIMSSYAKLAIIGHVGAFQLTEPHWMEEIEKPNEE